MKAIVAAVLSAFLANPAAAEKSIGVIGTGTLSCGVWLENSTNPEARALYTQWLVGFLSAYNYYRSNRQVTIHPDLASAGAWLDSYCRNNPLHPVFFAAAALVEASGGQAAVHQWQR